MTNLFHSPSIPTWFGNPEWRADYEAAGTWPADAVEVTVAEQAALRVALVPAAPTFAQLSAYYLDTVRVTRETILNRLAGIGMAAVIGADTITTAAVAAARTALLNITTDATVLAATDMDGLKAAVLAIYKAIVAVAPADMVKAFDGMDA